MGTAPKKLLERYSPPFGLMPLLMPRAYDNSAVSTSICELPRFPDKTKVMLRGYLSNFRVKQSGRLCFVYADLYEGTQKQICQWTATPSTAHAKQYALQSEAGTDPVQLVATITSFTGEEGNRVIFAANGKLAPLKEGAASLCAVPIYELRQGTRPHEIKKAVQEGIFECLGEKAMPDECAARLGLPGLAESLKIVHGLVPVPEGDVSEITEMRTLWHRRVTAELIFRTLVAIKGGRREGRSPVIGYDKEAMRSLAGTLPYTLTGDQLHALSEIFAVMGSGDFRRILLSADVGAGKTTVMGFAIFAALKAGYSAAVIAPSSVLARQLFEEYEKLLEPFGYAVHFAAKMTKAQKAKLQKKIDTGAPCLVVGTVTVNSFAFGNLGLVACDEEQKIGTEQKSALINAAKGKLPYQILSSATPIPRSLASTIYGSVKMVRMKNRPSGRLPIFTKVVDDEGSAHRLFSLIRSEVAAGHQALFVCPSISSGEMASIALAEELCNAFLPGSYISIHGQLKPQEIEKRVAAFKQKESAVLLSTSMVDSGFHADDLSVVVILAPDRFGLSMLHQIRGRVGRRAGLQGYCALYPPTFTLKRPARERLDYFCRTLDGFELASKDMQNRGSGDLAGTSQSGGEVNFIEHAELVEQIEQLIEEREKGMRAA